MTGVQEVPTIKHETQFGDRSHHRDQKCFLCIRSKDTMPYSCCRCWNAIKADEFLCGQCYYNLITEMANKIEPEFDFEP